MSSMKTKIRNSKTWLPTRLETALLSCRNLLIWSQKAARFDHTVAQHINFDVIVTKHRQVAASRNGRAAADKVKASHRKGDPFRSRESHIYNMLNSKCSLPCKSYHHRNMPKYTLRAISMLTSEIVSRVCIFASMYATRALWQVLYHSPCKTLFVALFDEVMGQRWTDR